MCTGYTSRDTIYVVEGLHYLCSKNKDADQLHGIVKLKCVFVFVSTKSRFSHDAAHIMEVLVNL